MATKVKVYYAEFLSQKLCTEYLVFNDADVPKVEAEIRKTWFDTNGAELKAIVREPMGGVALPMRSYVVGGGEWRKAIKP